MAEAEEDTPGTEIYASDCHSITDDSTSDYDYDDDGYARDGKGKGSPDNSEKFECPRYRRRHKSSTISGIDLDFNEHMKKAGPDNSEEFESRRYRRRHKSSTISGIDLDFDEYMKTELSFKLVRDGWVFWSRLDDEAACPPNFPCNNSDYIAETPIPSRELKDKIKSLLPELCWVIEGRTLIQFWAPIVTEGRLLLTTQNQPFALKSIGRESDIRLLRYRMKSKKYTFYVDGEGEEDLGLPGRVFRHKVPESTPNVKYYRIKEYPQRNHALRCGVKHSLAFPVFEYSGKTCVGVLELASTSTSGDRLMQSKLQIISLELSSQRVGLKCSGVHEHSTMQNGCKSRAIALYVSYDLRRALTSVSKATQVSLAQVWVPCGLCRDAGTFGLRYMRELWSTTELISHSSLSLFRHICQSSHLQKGQGIIGRALLSHNLLFCTDVTQFSVAEYPLAHYARHLGLSGCLVICLQSSYLKKEVYGLELFLPMGNETIGNMLTSLRMILKKLQEISPGFKLASGEDLGGELPIEVIEFHKGEKIYSSDIPQTTRSLSSVQRSDVASSYLQEKTLERPERKFCPQGADDQEQIPHTSSQALNTIASPRWPTENKKDNHSLLVESVEGDNKGQIPQTSVQAPHKRKNDNLLIQSVQGAEQEQIPQASSQASNTAMQDGNTVIIKARYGNDGTINFRLSLSSGLVDQLQHLVSKWLNIEGGTYYIKYKDEQDEDE